MLHDVLRVSPGGDRAIEVELGDGMDFSLNFTVHRLVAAVREAQIGAIEDLIPELASFQITYDPYRIRYEDLITEIAEIYSRIGSGISGSLPSRLITMPVCYFEPETTACIDDYRKTYPDKRADPDLLCEMNALPDRAALAKRHSSTEYWVAALGFWPGLCSLLPLRPDARIDRAIEDVDDQTGKQVDEHQEAHDRDDQRAILDANALKESPSDARNIEDALGDDGTAHQLAGFRAEERDHRNERIAQHMYANDPIPCEALRPRCAHVVSPEVLGD